MQTKLEVFNYKNNFKMCNLKKYFAHFEKCKYNVTYKDINK